MWAGDILSSPLLLAEPSGEPPLKIIAVMTREVGVPEGAQYLVGLLGALVVQQEIWAMVLLFLPTGLVYLAFKRGKEMNSGTRRILESMADTVDFRDPYTGGHSRRVTALTVGILQELGKQGPGFDLIVTAARVHDIGKIGLPDDVLLKESNLSVEEWELVKTHPDRGAELLEQYPSFARGAVIVRHHHERWDGHGYPHGLKGTDIPFGSRVIAVADSFDAMTTDRPYRRAMSAEKALAILASGRGREWDGAIVDAFLKSMAGRREQPVVPALRLVPDAARGEIDRAITA
jgi:HD-GYP domain-containing protein (c-di-GMP phosphodiesterase class II)